jgi:hypothetical protein
MKELKRFSLEVREFKRLIKDSLLNPNSDYFSVTEDDLLSAKAMLAELNKLEQFGGQLDVVQKVVNVEVFQPIHSWVFFFTSLSEVEYEKGEEFIRLMIDGVTIVKIPIDL